jgi:FKBP-type peptidyl-prolyl cis-trans isomerase
VPTNKQRREAARRHLERQLQRRQERDIARKRFVLIASIIGTLVVIAIVVVAITMITSDDKKDKTASSPTPSTSTTPSTSPTPSASPTKTYPPATGPAVSFDGIKVVGASDLKGEPQVTSKTTGTPTKLQYKDLVVGKGKTATDTSKVTAQYVGLIYKSGVIFQSSWKIGGAVPFTLGPGNVIDGFTQGIGGTTGVPPMKVGGRRIIVMPAALAYGANPPSGSNIPANSPLVFIVDLTALG